MVWTACYLFGLLLNENGYRGAVYPVAISIYCAFATYVTSQSSGTMQFYMFQSSQVSLSGGLGVGKESRIGR